MNLYHYTSFEKFIHYILPSMQLKFSSFSNCNDPYEFYKQPSIEINLNTAHNLIQISNEIEKQIKKYKLICFCKDSDSNGRKGWQYPTMWAHYADNHNGVCLEFDSDLLDLDENDIQKDIDYVDIIPENIFKDGLQNIENKIEEHEKILIDQTFFKKFKDWSIENEYRIIRKSDKSETDFLKIDNALKNVYLGFRASEEKHNSIKGRILEHLLEDKGINVNIFDDPDLSFYTPIKKYRMICEHNRDIKLR